MERLRRLVKWLGGQEPVVLGAILISVLAAWAFIELTDEVLDGESHAFDIWVLQSLRQTEDTHKPIGPAWAAEIGRDITSLGGYAILTLFTFGSAVFLWLDNKYRTMVTLLVAAVSGFFLTFGLKWLFQRPRPDVVPHLTVVSSASFPSGHSMMSAVIYLTLGTLLASVLDRRRLRLFVLGVALFLTVIVGCSRVYLGVHYPTDVMAGWAAGLVWAIFCWLVADALQKRGRQHPEEILQDKPTSEE